MKCKFILLYLLLVSGTSYGQIRDLKSVKFLRGYNEWEILQAECCNKVKINPLSNQSSELITSNLKIMVVREFIDDARNGKYLYYIHHYQINGNLAKTEAHFFKNSQGNYIPTIELIYHYNEKNNIDSIELVQQNGLVDPNELISLVFDGFSNYCVHVDKTHQFEEYREYFPNYQKGEFHRIIEYNKKDLISKVIYKVNGIIVRQIIYEYDYH